MRRLSRVVRLSLLLSSSLAAAVAALAVSISEARAAEKKTVAVGAFEGPKSKDARRAFIDALKSDGGYEVTDAEDVKHTAKDKAIAEAGKNLAVSAVITGKVNKFNLKLKVRDGATGKMLEEVELKGGTLPKLKAKIEESAASSVEGPVSQSQGERAKQEEQAEEPPAAEGDVDKPAEEATASSDDTPSTLSPLEVSAGLRGVHRTFEFQDTIADLQPNQGYAQLPSYDLPFGPALIIDLEFYPGSFVSRGPAEWLGLTAGYAKGFAIETVYNKDKKNAAGESIEQRLSTNLQEFYVGARFRYPLGVHQLGLSGVYGQHKWLLKGDEASALAPDVKYGYVRVGLDGRFGFGDFWAGVHVRKRFVTSTGSLEDDWFPSTKASSLEAGLVAGYRLTDQLDLVAGFDWLRYAFDFNPVPPRPENQKSIVAAGAVDQYLMAHLGLRFHLPAPGGAASSAGASEASVSAGTE